jgi:uncharacterized protein (TIGR00375 family)
MQIISDLHLHSKYSRAVSPQMEIPFMFQWEIKKGMGLLATGDWTHPLWFRELKANLDEDGSGILKLKESVRNNILTSKIDKAAEPKFLLSTEISLIYTQGGKGRRVHLLVWVPDFDTVEKINNELLKRRMNLSSDGRPIMNLTARDFTQIVLNVNPKTLVIPAHIWTPWFSVFGSMSGFDSLAECFADMVPNIYGIETGLSSDPVMNWQIKELDNRSIVSFSDAHSGAKLGREATTFNLESLTFDNLYKAIAHPDEKNNIAYTIEFYPEEGKYHYTGHRLCGISQTPAETKKNGVLCPKCHRPLTVGVMHRVENLAQRSEQELQLTNWQINKDSEIKGMKSKLLNKPPFVKIVPLGEIIGETMKFSAGSKKIDVEYEKLVSNLGGEFNVLLHAKIPDIARVANEVVAEGILKMRKQKITIIPGFDGQFGVVRIGENGKTESPAAKPNIPTDSNPADQLGLF